MPKETIFRFECSMCKEFAFARDVPQQWIRAWIAPGKRDPYDANASDSDVYLCATHAKGLIDTPSRLLHPNLRVERGTCKPEYVPQKTEPNKGLVPTWDHGQTIPYDPDKIMSVKG